MTTHQCAKDTPRSAHYRSLFAILTVGTLSLVFVATKFTTPHFSELSFIEHSVLGTSAGSMIPASCDSAPPTGHFNGDCDPMVNISVGNDNTSFTDITLSASAQTVLYAASRPTITWNSSGYTGCSLVQTAEGVATTIISALSGTNYTLPYTNETANVQEVQYSVNCTNPPYKNDSKGIRVWYDFNPL